MTGRWVERIARLAGVVRSQDADLELDAEFQSHVDLAAAEYERQGHSPSDARRLAAARFGSRLAAREIVDDQRRLPALDSLTADLRHAFRSVRRTPGFTAAAIAVLGIGLGTNLAVFTVASATLFKGFSGVANPERLLYLTTGRDCCISYQDLLDWRAEARSFSAIAAVADLRVSFDADGGTDTATATEVTSNLFAILGAQPSSGRNFTAADDVPGAARVAIISHDFWRIKFRADPGAIGRVVRLNGEPTTIVGVMPPGFVFPQRQDLWLPIGPRVSGQPRSSRGLWFAVGRLADDSTVDQARAEMTAIGERLSSAYPESNANVRPWVSTFRDFFIGQDAVAIYGALWAGVGLLLLIACANLVNLLLARGAGRTREVGVSLALGAGRGRIIRTQLFESGLLSIGGGAIGWFIATLLLGVYAAVAVPPTQPWASQLIDYSIDFRVFVYLAGVSLVAALLIGVLPALRASSLDIQAVLRDGGRGSVGRRSHRRTSMPLVATQVALSVVLLSAAGLLVRSFWNVSHRQLGYDSSRVVVALASLPASTYPSLDDQLRFFERVSSGVKSLPGMEAVAFVDGLSGQNGGQAAVEIEGQLPAEPPSQIRQRSISPGYFGALGTAVLAGRDFDDGADGSQSTRSAIVNRRFADLHWPAGNALGRRIRVVTPTTSGPWLTVVGIAPDLVQGDLARAAVDPTIYRPLRQRPGRGGWVVARTSLPPEAMIAPLRRQIQLADPALPIWLGPFTLDEWHAGTYWRRGLNGGLFALFAVLALVLACIGLSAVMAATVAQRRQELSLRRAIGATTGDVAWLVMRGGLMPAALGLAVGLIASAATNRLLSAQLVEVAPTDPQTFAIVVALIVVGSLTGCLPPLLQAARVDPVCALRGD